jgi:hypothetical protein
MVVSTARKFSTAYMKGRSYLLYGTLKQALPSVWNYVMNRRKRLIIGGVGAFLLAIISWASVRFLLLPGSNRTIIEIPSGDQHTAQLWLRLKIASDTATFFDILDLDIPRNTTSLTRCYSSLIFSQKTPYSFTTHPADFFLASTSPDGYSRSYMYDRETSVQGQTANYDLLNLCDYINPYLSTFNSARILAPKVVANTNTRSLLVGAVRDRYFYPFDQYMISLDSVRLSGIVLDTQPVEVAALSPSILLEADAPEWQVTAVSHVSELQEVRTELALKRPFVSRLLTATVLGMTVSFILFLGFMRRDTDVFGAAMGILLGLWGIRDVLLPSFVTWITIVDRVIVLCYLLLVIVLATRYTWRRVFRNVSEDRD